MLDFMVYTVISKKLNRKQLNLLKTTFTPCILCFACSHILTECCFTENAKNQLVFLLNKLLSTILQNTGISIQSRWTQNKDSSVITNPSKPEMKYKMLLKNWRHSHYFEFILIFTKSQTIVQTRTLLSHHNPSS